MGHYLAQPKLRYAAFLTGTLLLTSALYAAARQWSLGATFFLVINIGNAHYLMAYLAGGRSWRTLSRPIRKRRLSLWLGASALYFIVFYLFAVPFPWVLLSVLVIAAVHFFRDYAFFYHQFQSSFQEVRRPLALTLFLSGLYIALLFGLLAAFPEKIRVLFGGPIPHQFFVASGAIALAVALFAGFSFFSRVSLTYARQLPLLGALTLPYGSTGAAAILGGLNPIDAVYLLVLWHYLLWLAYTFIKVRRGAPNALVGFRNLPELTVNTIFAHAAIFLSAFALYRAGTWRSFPELAYQSFIFGLYGYPFWSILHIVFTAFPYRRSVDQR